MKLAAVILAVAIFSDLIGWDNLARVLRASILGGGYASIGVYVLFLVFQSLITFVLLFRPLNILRMVSRNRQTHPEADWRRAQNNCYWLVGGACAPANWCA